MGGRESQTVGAMCLTGNLQTRKDRKHKNKWVA